MVEIPIRLENPEFQKPEYSQLRSTIEQRNSELPDLKVRNNVIFKRMKLRTGDQTVDTTTLWKIWIPHGFKSFLMHILVSTPRNRENDKLSSQGVRKFITQCEICKETKAPNQTLRPPMGKAFHSERPFQRLYVDFLRPYPRSIYKKLLKPFSKATKTKMLNFLETETVMGR